MRCGAVQCSSDCGACGLAWEASKQTLGAQGSLGVSIMEQAGFGMGGGGVELWFSRGVNKIMERGRAARPQPGKKIWPACVGASCLACLA